MSVLLAPALHNTGSSISFRGWKINLDRAFLFLLLNRPHPGKLGSQALGKGRGTASSPHPPGAGEDPSPAPPRSAPATRGNGAWKGIFPSRQGLSGFAGGEGGIVGPVEVQNLGGVSAPCV